jgi:hypothetical protein
MPNARLAHADVHRHRAVHRARDLSRRALGCAMLLAAVVASSPAQPAAIKASPPSEYARLYDADQADRKIDPMLFARLSEPQLDSATRALEQRDAERLARMERLLTSRPPRTADDHYHAAMILQHSRKHVLRTHELTKRAIALDSTHAGARYLYAASWDSYQISLGRPQWYGTNVDRGPDGLAVIHATDTTQVDEPTRKSYTGWTYAERVRSVAALNERLRAERAKKDARPD